MAVVAPYSPPLPLPTMRDDLVMDTRTPSPRPRGDPVMESTPDAAGESDYQPDLSAEVALLSTKLVNAINFQTNLDDTLQHTRHELEHSRQKSDALEAENKRITDMIAQGVLVKRSEMDERLGRLRAELAAEKSARETAEKARKETENELENLTSALFEEANTMVAAARKDAEVVERKNLQLKEQLHDTEMMMVSQTEQLRELKESLEKLQAAEGARMSRDPSVPSTPIATASMDFETLQQISPANSAPGMGAHEQPPDHPLHFSQLLAPVLRDDTAAFSEFQDLLQMARRLGVHSRTNSNQTTASTTHSNLPSATANAATSSPGMPGGFNFSANSSPSSISTTFGGASASSSLPALKDSRFYKRVLTEDLEPTLRLDIAPGLSFLSRRTVLSALLTGSLTVEPFPQNKHYYACALCGESRRTEPWIRKHHFRTSEDDSAPKPLCGYCLGRLRAACDFVGFLRMVREGLWRCEQEQERKSAWEESVRLRERMFWARVGGGVVPAWQVAAGQAAHGNSQAQQAMVGVPEEEQKPAGGSSSAKSGSERASLESIPEGRPVEAQAQAPAQAQASAGAAPAFSEEIQSPATEDEAKFTTPPPSRHEAQAAEEPEEDRAVTPTSELAAAASTTSFEDAKELASPTEEKKEEEGVEEEVEEVVAEGQKEEEKAAPEPELPETTTPEPATTTSSTLAADSLPSTEPEDHPAALPPPSTTTLSTTPSSDTPKSRKLPSRPASSASTTSNASGASSSSSRLPTTNNSNSSSRPTSSIRTPSASRPTSSIRTPSASRPTSALRTPSASRPVSSSLSTPTAAAASPAGSGTRSSSVLARVRAMEKEGAK